VKIVRGEIGDEEAFVRGAFGGNEEVFEGAAVHVYGAGEADGFRGFFEAGEADLEYSRRELFDRRGIGGTGAAGGWARAAAAVRRNA